MKTKLAARDASWQNSLQKKQTAQAKVDEVMDKGKYGAEQKKMIRLLSSTAMAGVKMVQIMAQGQKGVNATDACTKLCAKAKVDCDTKVVCKDHTVGSSRRHLLKEKPHELSLNMNPNEVDTAAAIAIVKKDPSLTVNTYEKDPNTLFTEIGIDSADADALKTTTSAAGVASQEYKTANDEFTAAQQEETAATTEVTAAEKNSSNSSNSSPSSNGTSTPTFPDGTSKSPASVARGLLFAAAAAFLGAFVF